MVLTVAGQLPEATRRGTVLDVPQSAGGMGGRNFASVLSKRGDPGDANLLQFSAVLFSVAQGRSVAHIDLQYSGSSADEATNQFLAKLAQTLPATTCAGWIWSADVDAERIRKLDS